MDFQKIRNGTFRCRDRYSELDLYVDHRCTDQTCTWLLLTMKHLSHRGTEAFISTYEKSVSSVGGHEVTACFTSVSAAHCFPVRSFLRGSKETENARPHAAILVAALGLCSVDHPRCSADLPHRVRVTLMFCNVTAASNVCPVTHTVHHQHYRAS
jgi:hypothetical protein